MKYGLAGYVFSHDGDLVKVMLGANEETNECELYFNDDPYGVMVVFGMDDLGIKEIPSDDLDEAIAETVGNLVRGEQYCGAIYAGEKLIMIKDVDNFEADIHPLRAGEGAIEENVGLFNVCDVFDDCGNASEIIGLLETL